MHYNKPIPCQVFFPLYEHFPVPSNIYILFITASGFIPGGSGTTMTHNTE